MIGKYLYWVDVSEKKPVEIWPFKTGLGQGLRHSEICYRKAKDTFSFVNLTSIRQFKIPKDISLGKDFGFVKSRGQKIRRAKQKERI